LFVSAGRLQEEGHNTENTVLGSSPDDSVLQVKRIRKNIIDATILKEYAKLEPVFNSRIPLM
jgi:hypothetical protein